MTVDWKPKGYSSLSPYLVSGNAEAAIGFMVDALGGVPVRRYERPDGSIKHAEVRIDDTVVMIGGAIEGWPAVPSHVHLYVPDVDVAIARALAHGADLVQPASTSPDDPDRRGGVRDPGGTTWWLSTQVG